MAEITVILPSYNVADYIGECLESVVTQTFQDMEILCIDAGSTDGTLEIIKDYMGSDARIRLYLSDKKSFGYQMNLGIRMTQSPYVAFVETDDYVLQDMLATLHGLAREHDADLVKADFDNVVRLSDGQTWALREGFGAGETTYYDRVISLKKHPELYIAEYLYWRGLYKREFLTQHGLCFQETPGASNQDIGFSYQLYLHADRVYFTRDAFYQYRRNRAESSNYCRDALDRLMQEYQYIEEKVKPRAEGTRQLQPYYWQRLFRQLLARVRLFAAYGDKAQEPMQAFGYFQGLFEKAEQDGEIDEMLWNATDLRELYMFLSDIGAYVQYQRLAYTAKRRQLREFTEKVRARKEAVIFGCGREGGFCNCFLQSRAVSTVKVFCDNHKTGSFMGKAVLTPDEAVREYRQAVFVLAGGRYNGQMKGQLLGLGIPEEQIVIYGFGIDWLYLQAEVW